MSRATDTAPLPDELEVSIFGPGKGEALAVHLGANDWMTVDSCRDQASGVHPVLSYLERIRVSASADIRLVVGTHAHDDHIAGISELYSAAKSAQFVTSSALTSSELFAALEADEVVEAQLRQGVRKEYRAVLEEVERRRGRSGGRPIRHAIEQRELWSRAANGAIPSARVVALSPSDEAIERALDVLRSGFAREGSRKRLDAGDPNEFAIALWVEVGDTSALLGADLLIGPEGCGWKAVVATHHPAKAASLYKVPHHGSPNADHLPVWDTLLTSEVISLVAPFRGGNNPRPSVEDVARIAERSSAAYTTAHARLPVPSKATKRQRADLGGLATNVREVWGQAGHVRARVRAGQPWEVELIPPAHKLKA